MEFASPFAPSSSTPSRAPARPARLEGYDNYPGQALFSGQLEGGFHTPDRSAGRLPLFDEAPSSLSRTRLAPPSSSSFSSSSAPRLPSSDALPSVSLLDGLGASFAAEQPSSASFFSPPPGPSSSSSSSSSLSSESLCWVLVFGFPAAQAAQVIEELLSCGQIVSHAADSPLSNWMHVLFETPLGAQRALTRDGMVLERLGLMVGVRRSPGPGSKPRTAAGAATAAAAATGSVFLQQQASRDNSVTASQTAFEYAPYPVNSWWARVKYYFFW